jgi:hypothetical protein
MRAWNSLFLCFSVVIPFLASGCAKEVKAEFPRPPATASIAEPDEDEPLPVAEESPSDEPDATDEAEPAPVAEIPTPPPAAEPPVRRPPPSVPAKPPPTESEQPPSTQLSGSDLVDPEVLAKMRRAGTLLGSVESRMLSTEQREQVTAAKAFVAQARDASAEGDERRALVLIDKALILAEDVERSSRR